MFASLTVSLLHACFRFLPAQCAEHLTCKKMEEAYGESSSKEKEQPDDKKADRRLDFGWWQVAWQRYGLAAVATGQMSLAQCNLHANLILDLAALAPSQGRSAWLAVLYDELARQVCILSHAQS